MGKDKKKLEQKRKDIKLPSKKELRKEFDMPGADIETVRKAFFQPVKVIEEG